jgi:L-lactate dehydrogenase complex protein LldG
MVEEPPMSTEREKIFGRIREALTIQAPHPGTHGGHSAPIGFRGRPVAEAQSWLPPGGRTHEEQIERFRAASTELKTDFRVAGSQEEALALLKQIADAEGWKQVASHRGVLTDAAVNALGLPSILTDGGYDVNRMEACDAGVTECESLVAQTGSVLVTNPSSGGRALSVLPPHHVVLARQEQLVPDLSVALERVKRRYSPNFPSMISFITGPSRTGDIERILVLGAHGPKKLTVILW